MHFASTRSYNNFVEKNIFHKHFEQYYFSHQNPILNLVDTYNDD